VGLGEGFSDCAQAELAFAVLPQHRGRGIATVLAALLILEAYRRGFKTMEAYVHAENSRGLPRQGDTGSHKGAGAEGHSRQGREAPDQLLSPGPSRPGGGLGQQGSDVLRREGRAQGSPALLAR